LSTPARIPLLDQRGKPAGFATVDAEDAEWVTALGPWYRAELWYEGQGRPAAHNQIPHDQIQEKTWNSKREPDHYRPCNWTWLHNLVTQIPDKHTDVKGDCEVVPLNGYWLDCRKDNLLVQARVWKPKQQEKPKQRRERKAG
jgi:hypothetical protein